MIKFFGWAIATLILLPVMALLLMFFWADAVPDVFAGAVEMHLLPAFISFEQSFKLIGLFSALGIGIGWGAMAGMSFRK